MLYNDQLLTEKSVPPSHKIKQIINKVLDAIDLKSNIIKVLIQNPYEKMIPFNLWFWHPKYKIIDIFENNQHMRARYYDNRLLTPLIPKRNNNDLVHLDEFIWDMSLYQPFYPETFYIMWDFLQMKHLEPKCNPSIKSVREGINILQIGRDDRLGSMEAIILFHEKYQHKYQYNTYDYWLTGKEMYDKTDGSYRILVPEINYLEQAYKINFINDSRTLSEYDLISIDANHLLDNIFKWSEEELDLQANLFYFLHSMQHLKTDGSIIIRLNMISSPSWTVLFDIAYNYFKEYTFIRPSISNPFNSEIYLFLTKFEKRKSLDSTQNRIFKNLYRQHTYTHFHLNYDGHPENPIIKKYQESVDKWINNINQIITHGNKQNSINSIDAWHASNDLKQIKHLNYIEKNPFNEGLLSSVIKTSAKNFELKPIVSDKIYTMQFYKKLIEKRAELNYHKRVMDTKPSMIFMDNPDYNNNNYLLSWETLTNQLDVFKGIKFQLKNNYNTEMTTNAFMKMYEMLNYIDLTSCSNKKSTIKTFHLCEAPGAFIAATNHYLSDKGFKWEWYAQTLKPTSTGSDSDAALDDHFGLIASYPDRWLFGNNIDDSGDITHSSVIRSYASNPLLSDIDFMTADAGLKCHPNELNEQEAFLGKINMGQIICILACLSTGKSAIFKTFLPMSEPITISMIYLVTHLFESVNVIKPTTSHSYNSEIYIELKNYKGIDKKILELLYILLDDPKITSKTLLFNSIDMPFFKSYMNTMNAFIDRQIHSICRNYYYYYHMDLIGQIKNSANNHIVEWLEKNKFSVLQDHQKLIKKQTHNKTNAIY
jgi:hypothetical protein